jgi:hypothetical protein
MTPVATALTATSAIAAITAIADRYVRSLLRTTGLPAEKQLCAMLVKRRTDQFVPAEPRFLTRDS